MSRIIGKNLREARKQSGYSLETLAQKSGVSRAMLGQIETARSVPTVTVIWRIADALGIAISALISNPQPEPVSVIRADRQSGVAGPIRPLWPADRTDEPRLFEIKLGLGQSEHIAVQSAPLRTHLVVAKGRLSLECPAEPPIDLGEGDVAVFDAQQAVRIVNRGAVAAVAYLARYPKRSA